MESEKEPFDDVLGCRGRDAVTGFTGVITGACVYLLGATLYRIEAPPASLHAEAVSMWFDANRVVVSPSRTEPAP